VSRGLLPRKRGDLPRKRGVSHASVVVSPARVVISHVRVAISDEFRGLFRRMRAIRRGRVAPGPGTSRVSPTSVATTHAFMATASPGVATSHVF